ncbi:MAG: LacI family DNA-binding transcriptional regulator [bacterium]
MNSQVSLKDVARVAGVDTSTVSRVLTGKAAKGRIASTTQARIRSAANQLGYVPKPLILFSRAAALVPEPLPVADVVPPVSEVAADVPAAEAASELLPGTNAGGTPASTLGVSP